MSAEDVTQAVADPRPLAGTTPVVFLPGIMGSRLRWTVGGWEWDPDSTWAMLPWYRKALYGGETLARLIHHDQPAEVMTDMRPSVPPAYAGRGWEGVSRAYYHSLLESMSTVGPVHAFGYDWRQDMLVEAGRVRARIEAAVPGPFALVTHSMGGLLARAMLAADPGLARRVRGVVHICQPCHGAPVLYRRLFTGCSGLDIHGWLDRIFCRILGRSADRFATNTVGLPGALQLLPSYEYEYPAGNRLTGYRGNAPGGFVAGLYGHPTSPPGLRRIGLSPSICTTLEKQLVAVSAFHDAVRTVYFPRTWFLIGDGIETDLGFDYIGTTFTQPRLPGGDGTVPAGSAFSTVAVPSTSNKQQPAATPFGFQALVPSATGVSPAGQLPTLAQLIASPATIQVGSLVGLEHAAACTDENIHAAVLSILKIV